MQVTRKQFENLKSRRDAGEEVDFESLETDGDHLSTAKGNKKNKLDGKEVEELKRYW